MPIHDWTRVSAGTFHGFHTHWISDIARTLNNEILPDAFYAEPEQTLGKTVPDVLTLEAKQDWETSGPDNIPDAGGTAVATAPPAVSFSQIAAEAEFYAEKKRRIAIRHTSGDRVVAYIEIVSSGNKDSARRFEQFVDKACSVLEQHIHLLAIDVYPPGSRDPEGIHAAIWNQVDPSAPFLFPDDRNRTAVSYQATMIPVAWIEPMRVGDQLPNMPVFITSETYVTLPLEASYCRAFEAIPKHHRKTLISNLPTT